MLCKNIIVEEIKVVVYFMDDNKVSGVDGFNVYFFKKVWIIIGKDVIKVV